MTQMIDPKAAETSPETDLVAAVLRVLGASPEPLTVSKIRAKLPSPFRTASLEELTDALQRQVAANVLFQYPKYRSQQDRFWDRPMPVHLATLFRAALEEGPLGWAELRRKLPAYAVDPLAQAEVVLMEQVAQGLLHRHPRTGKRGGDRFGLQPPDAKDYLRSELAELFGDLEQLGFSQAQLRAAALELLHDEEWSPTSAPSRGQPSGGEAERPRTDTPAAQQPGAAPAATQPPHAQEWARAQTASPETQTEAGAESSAPVVEQTPGYEQAKSRPETSPAGSNQL